MLKNYLIYIGLTAVLGGASLVFNSCASTTGTVSGSVYVHQEPPPRRVITAPPAPSSTAVWIPGQWRWNGYRYVWMPGYWELHPRGVWVPGYWNQTPHGWVWVYGHWR